MSGFGLAVSVLGSLATVLALVLALPIALISTFSRANLTTLSQGVLIFASTILVALVILGLIWRP